MATKRKAVDHAAAEPTATTSPQFDIARKRSTIPNALLARYPVTLTAADLLAAVGAEHDPPEPIDFTPVPRLRKRRGGWSEQAQRDFIACLQRSGSVAASARAVGMTASTAYRLLDAEGAESFALAWDKAFEEGLRRLRENSLDRALNGIFVPVYRNGRLVRVEHRRNDRLAIALLGGRNRDIDWYRQGALRRHVYKMELKAADEEKAAKKRREAEAQRAYDEELQRMLDKAAAMNGPRVRRL
jgi:hypothetical protein